jgi:hypothetical protein
MPQQRRRCTATAGQPRADMPPFVLCTDGRAAPPSRGRVGVIARQTGEWLGGDRPLVQTVVMSIEEWWPKLPPATRDWLIANNGDAVPAAIVEEIMEAGGPEKSDAWWVGQDGSTDFFMPDEAIDWIEEIGNAETPSGQ